MYIYIYIYGILKNIWPLLHFLWLENLVVSYFTEHSNL